MHQTLHALNAMSLRAEIVPTISHSHFETEEINLRFPTTLIMSSIVCFVGETDDVYTRQSRSKKAYKVWKQSTTPSTHISHVKWKSQGAAYYSAISEGQTARWQLFAQLSNPTKWPRQKTFLNMTNDIMVRKGKTSALCLLSAGT